MKSVKKVNECEVNNIELKILCFICVPKGNKTHILCYLFMKLLFLSGGLFFFDLFKNTFTAWPEGSWPLSPFCGPAVNGLMVKNTPLHTFRWFYTHLCATCHERKHEAKQTSICQQPTMNVLNKKTLKICEP